MSNENPVSASDLAQRIVARLTAEADITDLMWYDGSPDDSTGWADDTAAEASEPEVIDYAVIETPAMTLRLNGEPDGVRWHLVTRHEDDLGLPVTADAGGGVSTGDIAAIVAAIQVALVNTLGDTK